MSLEIDFPPVEQADHYGVVAWTRTVTSDMLLAGYRQGLFPWPTGPADDIPWFSPDPRAIFELDEFHLSRRLRQTIASGKFQTTRDRDFVGVLQGCAERRVEDGPSWLTPALQRALVELHGRGYAHSVECWQSQRLVGGVYGVALGGYFSAESMYFHERDASKVALASLVDHLRRQGFALLDIQVATEHTKLLGAREIARAEFMSRLDRSLSKEVCFDAPR
jgi:leucyl/phenylalanyl-tRNA--protein transferase